MSESILATYLIETPLPLEVAADAIAGEQSCGTFVSVPGETEELKARSRAKVLAIEPLETTAQPSLPGSRDRRKNVVPEEFRRARIRVQFPFANVGANLPTLFSTVAGNLYELSELSGLKLLDLEIPEAFQARYPGPQFGVEGTRRLTGVRGRPVIGTIIKPSVGLTPEQTAELVRTLGEAGVDFIKDDELMADPPHSPLKQRVDAVLKVIDALADRHGRRIMYAFNISDEMESMLRHHDAVAEAGGTCVMVSLNSVGFAGVSELRRRCSLPIHGHRNGWGMYSRHPMLGIAFNAYQKLWRLAGVDHLHCNGIGNKFWEPDDSVVESAKACLRPMFGGYQAMPVLSSGQWGGQAPESYRRIGTCDVMYLAGGGIMAHPGGPGSGVKAIQQAWEAAARGIDLNVYAATHPELKQSIAAFG